MYTQGKVWGTFSLLSLKSEPTMLSDEGAIVRMLVIYWRSLEEVLSIGPCLHVSFFCLALSSGLHSDMKSVVRAFASELQDSYRLKGFSADEDWTLCVTGLKGMVWTTLYLNEFSKNCVVHYVCIIGDICTICSLCTWSITFFMCNWSDSVWNVSWPMSVLENEQIVEQYIGERFAMKYIYTFMTWLLFFQREFGPMLCYYTCYAYTWWHSAKGYIAFYISELSYERDIFTVCHDTLK